MNLKCMINGKINGVFLPSYNDNNRLLQGNTIADEYSDTLDSGSIVLSDCPKIKDLQPYDDVFIWDCDYLPIFTGYTDAATLRANGKFYKHLLVDRFTEERNLLNQNNYTYKIELFSETKGLEIVVCPNIKITQPLDFSKKLSTSVYMQHYLEMYSPKIKKYKASSPGWEYAQKYTLSQEMIDLFKDHYCQEFYLNSPTLRELFSKLMVSKDCIPYVVDDVIYPLKLSETRGNFNITNAQKSFLVAQKTSDNYVTSFRTNFNNALSDRATCHRVEQLGFRNSDEAIMTIKNMRLETSFPIYKLNKVYMCYYKQCKAYFPNNKSGYFYFMCRQDITPLCVLNNERQALYKDTRVASQAQSEIAFMKENYYFTVGYSIGSNLITGFGETFDYIDHFGLTTWNKNECIVRNILNNIDRIYPYGIDGKEAISNKIYSKMGLQPSSIEIRNNVKGIATMDSESSGNVPSIFLDDAKTDLAKALIYCRNILYTACVPTVNPTLVKPSQMINDTIIWVAGKAVNALSGDSVVIKSLTFDIDYEGFYNGAILTDKETFKKNIQKVDNQSGSMPILALDGIAREKKIDKMGNKMYTLETRYENWEDVQNVGTKFVLEGSDENQEEDEEVIIYHRDVSIYDNAINVTYYAQENYILKNYYTSVFAKQRLYNVLDYGNSVTRAENRKDLLFLSKNKKYNIQPNFSSSLKIKDYLSFYLTTINDEGVSNLPINKAIMKSNNSPYYTMDINTFTYGKSICFNVKMFDNITAGTNIDVTHLGGKVFGGITESNEGNFRGTSQQLCVMYDDYSTGRISDITFTLGSNPNNTDGNYFEIFPSIDSNFNERTETQTAASINWYVPSNNTMYSFTKPASLVDIAKWQTYNLHLPQVIKDNYFYDKFITERENINCRTYKDAGETLDFTFQTQLLIDKKDKRDVYFSDLALKLSNLLGYVTKGYATEIINQNIEFAACQFKEQQTTGNNDEYKYVSHQAIFVKVPKSAMTLLLQNRIDIPVRYTLKIQTSKNDMQDVANDSVVYYRMSTNSIYFVDENKIRVNCAEIMSINKGNISTNTDVSNSHTYFYLYQVSNSIMDDDNKNDYYYFSNIAFTKLGSSYSAYQDYRCPIIANYYYQNDLETHPNFSSYTYQTLQEDGHIAIPNDNNGANTAFFGYTPNVEISPTQINEVNNFTPEKGYFGAIGNYFDRTGNNDEVFINNDYQGADKRGMKTYEYQGISPNTSDNSDLKQFYIRQIDLFRTTDRWYMYKSFSIQDLYSNIEIQGLDSNLYCVVSKNCIERDMSDEKVAYFDSNSSILNTGQNNPIRVNQVFNISYPNDNSSSKTATLTINLNSIPNLNEKDANQNYVVQSIQEWIYNSSMKAYEFVCGFNISDAERQAGQIVLNISLVGNLDLQVYKDGILYGTIKNQLDSNSPDVIPINQE